MKTCSKCGKTLPLTEYPWGGRACRKCRSKASGEWNRKNGNGQRRSWLLRYNLTPEQYADKMREQGNVCAICKRPPNCGKKFLSVDHDHECCSGQKTCGKCVRGLLCQSCNQAIGHMQENTAVLYRAIEYLNSYS